jgi:dihydrofolate reductase
LNNQFFDKDIMGRLISSINMTLDGFCDHTAVIADDELHQNANELLQRVNTIIFGRITYQLMEQYWPEIVNHPTGNPSVDEFARLIDNIQKIVFSNTLQKVSWKNSQLAKGGIKEEVLKLKQDESKTILVGSPSIIMNLLNLRLIGEFQFCVHPIILGKGMPLFQNIIERIDLQLVETKAFRSGAIVLHYQPVKG